MLSKQIESTEPKSTNMHEDSLKLSDIVGSYGKVWGKHGEEVRRMRGREGKREGARGQPEAI